MHAKIMDKSCTLRGKKSTSMKAAVFSEYSRDPAKVVKITEIDLPKLKSNEVMIKVESAAFNYNDLWAVWGEPIKIPLPHISGTDIAGSVTDIGSAVTTIKVGDRVVSHANLSCRTCYLCTSGREYDCNSRLVWGFQTGPLWGGFAQFAKVPEVNVVKLPSGISFNDAAAIAMVGLTSWHMLVGRARIMPGQCVLVMDGTSGVIILEPKIHVKNDSRISLTSFNLLYGIIISNFFRGISPQFYNQSYMA
jgi:alcohol dehydrogenase